MTPAVDAVATSDGASQRSGDDSATDPLTEAVTGSAPDRPASRLILGVLGIWAVIAVGLLAAAWFTITTANVSGPSMEPTLRNGDTVIASKVSAAGVGDVVTATIVDVDGRDHSVIKRVIGVAGDVLEYRDCRLVRNGASVDEPDVHPSSDDGLCGEGFGTIRVPDDHVWLMGDHRARSRDSRSFGAVPADAVNAVLLFVW